MDFPLPENCDLSNIPLFADQLKKRVKEKYPDAEIRFTAHMSDWSIFDVLITDGTKRGLFNVDLTKDRPEAFVVYQGV